MASTAQAVTVDEAANYLEITPRSVLHMLKTGVLTETETDDGGALVSLDSLLEFERYCAAHPRSALDDVFDEVEAAGLY